MDKEVILEIMQELYSDVEFMRKEGETDLRSVLHKISYATRQIKEELNK